MEIKYKDRRENTLFSELVCGDTFRPICNGDESDLYMKLPDNIQYKDICVNAVSLNNGSLACASDAEKVIKIEGEFIEK